MTNKNYMQALSDKGYVMNDGEIGFEKWINNNYVQLYISPEDNMYLLRVYNCVSENEFAQNYKSMQTLSTALKNKGLL